MSAKVTINSTSLDRKLAAMAILSQRTLKDCVRDGAKRFIKQAVRNTAPMHMTKSPSQAKRDWEQKRTKHYEDKRLTKSGYRKYAEVKRILAAKKKKLGRSAGGWNAAAVALDSKSPAWVKRHGSSEGRYTEQIKKDRVLIRVTNSVPYNAAQNMKRAIYALRRVERGFNGNLRVMKRKLIRSIR